MKFQRKHASIKMLSSVVNSNEKQLDLVEKNTLLISHTTIIINNNYQRIGKLLRKLKHPCEEISVISS